MTLTHIEMVAKRKLAPLPDGWELVIWEKVGPDGHRVSGGVPRITRAGKKKWPPNRELLTVVIVDAEIAARGCAIRVRGAAVLVVSGEGRDFRIVES